MIDGVALKLLHRDVVGRIEIILIWGGGSLALMRALEGLFRLLAPGSAVILEHIRLANVIGD